jgi:peptide/nickel transport system substrate-binding protein
MERRDLLRGGLAAAGALAGASLPHGRAQAQAAGDPIRKLVLITRPQSNNPQAYQAAEIMAQEWRKLGLEIELRPMPRQQQSDMVWRRRDQWDMTMWQQVGRPERSDPDELVFNLFHSSTAPTGYNYVGWISQEYDQVAEAQRVETDPEKRQALVRRAQEIASEGQPYVFLVHPHQLHAFNRAQLRESSLVMQAGLGLRNIWTYLAAEPAGQRRDLVLSASEPVQAIHPLWVSGATDSWVTELVWDRLMRIGPDGLPKPWAAETVTQVNPTTIDASIRTGMAFHDGQPVTIEDVIYSLEAPGIGQESPMYRPFVLNIARVERTGDRSLRVHLKQPDAAFLTTCFAKLNIIQKSFWEPVMQEYLNRPENVERYVVERPIGSGPFKVARARLNEEIVLERNPAHWSPPNVERWILRIVQNVEATLAMLNRGEINLLADYTGDGELLQQLTSRNRNLALKTTVDIGFQNLGFNCRRAPFDQVAFRRALSASVIRQLMANAAWNGFADPSNGCVSPAMPFWYRQGVLDLIPKGGTEAAKGMLAEAGYRLVDGRLRYPPGVRETTTPT